jgi:hypothetical protein
MVAGSESMTAHARASRLIAEALVEGHDSEVFVQRAQSMGLSRGLTDVLLAACPCTTSQNATRANTRGDQVRRVEIVRSH